MSLTEHVRSLTAALRQAREAEIKAKELIDAIGEYAPTQFSGEQQAYDALVTSIALIYSLLPKE